MRFGDPKSGAAAPLSEGFLTVVRAAVAAGVKLDETTAAFAIAPFIAPSEIGDAQPRLSIFVLDASLQLKRRIDIDTPDVCRCERSPSRRSAARCWSPIPRSPGRRRGPAL